VTTLTETNLDADESPSPSAFYHTLPPFLAAFASEFILAPAAEEKLLRAEEKRKKEAQREAAKKLEEEKKKANTLPKPVPVRVEKKPPVAKRPKTYKHTINILHAKAAEELFSPKNDWALKELQKAYHLGLSYHSKDKKITITSAIAGEAFKKNREQLEDTLEWIQRRLRAEKDISKTKIRNAIIRSRNPDTPSPSQKEVKPSNAHYMGDIILGDGRIKKASWERFTNLYPEMVQALELVFDTTLRGTKNKIIFCSNHENDTTDLRGEQCAFVAHRLMKFSYETDGVERYRPISLKNFRQIVYGATAKDENVEDIQKALAYLKKHGLPSLAVAEKDENPATLAGQLKVRLTKVKRDEEDNEDDVIRYRAPVTNRKNSIDTRAVKERQQRIWNELSEKNKSNPREKIQTKRNRSIRIQEEPPITLAPIAVTGIMIGDDRHHLIGLREGANAFQLHLDYSFLLPALSAWPNTIFDSNFIQAIQSGHNSTAVMKAVYEQALQDLWGDEPFDTKAQPALTVRFTFNPEDTEEGFKTKVLPSFATTSHIISSDQADRYRQNGHSSASVQLKEIYQFFDQHQLVEDAKKPGSDYGYGAILNSANKLARNAVRRIVFENNINILTKNIIETPIGTSPVLLQEEGAFYELPTRPTSKPAAKNSHRHTHFSTTAQTKGEGLSNNCKTFFSPFQDAVIGPLNSLAVRHALMHNGHDMLSLNQWKRLAYIHNELSAKSIKLQLVTD